MTGQPPAATDDLYALGAILYELLTSKPPFYNGDIQHQVQNLAPVPLEKRLLDLNLGNPIPPEVAAVVMACLSKDPMQRPPGAHAVAERFGWTQKAAPMSGPSAWLGAAGSVRRKWVTATGVVALLIALGAAGSFWRSGSNTKSTDTFKLEAGWVPLFKPGVIA